MHHEIGIREFQALRDTFAKFFTPYGQVRLEEHSLHFSSRPEHVSTSFAVWNDGRFSANMPLHEIDARFENLRFDSTSLEVHAMGSFGNYTYRIPHELIEKNKGDSA
ncbi:MAG: hypothetical protein L7S56_04430 [Candidatus Poseidonia sp.]|nr:hypothetical protein [Poseidonia sp.]